MSNSRETFDNNSMTDFDCNNVMNFDDSSTINAATMRGKVAAAWMENEENEENEEERVKKFPFSKTKGVVLENEKIFSLGNKEKDGNFWLLGEGEGIISSCCLVFLFIFFFWWRKDKV